MGFGRQSQLGVGILALALLCLPPTVWASSPERALGSLKLAQLTFCVPPQVWSKKRQSCVNPFVRAEVSCNAPEVWSAAQKRCVVPAAAAAADGPDLAEIQTCLNDLGYKAGRVDGRPGQRTRRAWNNYRRDKNLGGPVRRFNDPKTLESLLKDCEAAKTETAAETEPAPEVELAPKPKPAAAPTPAKAEPKGEAAAGYAEVLCVSKSLHKALSPISGQGAKLAVCGEACVPVPPGMSAAQIKQSEQEYSVKWCRNCIQVGKAGLICGQNR
ncbi:MAG: peptidoglycan-binding domain-containing protein [Pseudomonadota bacterium]